MVVVFKPFPKHHSIFMYIPSSGINIFSQSRLERKSWYHPGTVLVLVRVTLQHQQGLAGHDQQREPTKHLPGHGAIGLRAQTRSVRKPMTAKRNEETLDIQVIPTSLSPLPAAFPLKKTCSMSKQLDVTTKRLSSPSPVEGSTLVSDRHHRGLSRVSTLASSGFVERSTLGRPLKFFFFR